MGKWTCSYLSAAGSDSFEARNAEDWIAHSSDGDGAKGGDDGDSDNCGDGNARVKTKENSGILFVVKHSPHQRVDHVLGVE